MTTINTPKASTPQGSISLSYNPSGDDHTYVVNGTVFETTIPEIGIGVQTTFTANASLPPGRTPIQYIWDVGNGDTKYGNPITFTFTTDNPFQRVRLTVIDDTGKSYRISQQIPLTSEEAELSQTATVHTAVETDDALIVTGGIEEDPYVFGEGVYPTPEWRAYANDSVFNTPIPEGVPSKSNSAGIIERLTDPTGPSYYVAEDRARDFGVAVYYPRPTDPSYIVTCTEPWGTAEVEGVEVHFPAGAKPSGVWPLDDPDDDWDSHFVAIDQETGIEYDLWNIREITEGSPGEIVCKWGGVLDIDGDGQGGYTVAAEWGALAGMIRADEFVAGEVNHALSLTVPCTLGFHYPATKGGWECGMGGESLVNALVMGDLLQLNITDPEIAAFPLWKQGILRAWRDYGAYVRDTTASQDWVLWFESAAGYTTQGEDNPYVTVATGLGMTPEDYNSNGEDEYWFDIPAGVDWASRLRVVDWEELY